MSMDLKLITDALSDLQHYLQNHYLYEIPLALYCLKTLTRPY
jgi:hypothetical protein